LMQHNNPCTMACICAAILQDTATQSHNMKVRVLCSGMGQSWTSKFEFAILIFQKVRWVWVSQLSFLQSL
jgi:hypothetical protein